MSMAIEIERKFLVTGDEWRKNATVLRLRQGYLSTNKNAAVRVRTCGDKAWLTIKGPSVNGSALEFEYPISPEDGAAMLDALAQKPIIEKMRHIVPYGGMTWEVDEFLGVNAGLILAEIELTSPDQAFSLPPWVGCDVTGDARYYNANLVTNPYSRWGTHHRASSE